MVKQFNFRLLDIRYPIDEVSKLTDQLTDQDWNQWGFRQTTWDVHAQTRTIPIAVNSSWTRPSELYTFDRDSHWWPMFEQHVAALEAILLEHHGSGYLLQFILVKLLAHREIPAHRDSGWLLEANHRYHIAVKTDPRVQFTVGNECIHMHAGEIWEINNSEQHSVVNASDLDRLHIIADWSSRPRP
jgi:quercetin dioxygenase-like cupin family protein